MTEVAAENSQDLLAPIAGDNPAGVDLRLDSSPSSIYYQIKGARGDARADERRVLMEDDRASMGKLMPGWSKVLELAPVILSQHAKDLEIVAWYTEAQLRAAGFEGLGNAFRLTRELVEQYWDQLYPMPDEDGIVTRVAPLTGLNGDNGEGTLIGPIYQVPITQGYTDQAYATWHYQQAFDLSKVLDEEKREARIKNGAITMSQIERSALETPFQFYENLIAALDQCIGEFQQLCKVLESKAGADAPPSSNIRNALKKVRDTVGFLTKDMFANVPEQASAGQESGAAMLSATKAGITGVPDAINNRDDAVRALLKVAEYFRKTEPHSPVSYSLEQAIRWTRMSLPELLAQLIPDESARNEYFRLTGVIPKTESE
jgi:type VI secretion system protein ImpA